MYYEGGVSLNYIIKRLAEMDRTKVIKRGLTEPHSYRGYYDCLAFSNGGQMTVNDLLNLCREQMGETHVGYKGGDFIMDGDTECYLASWGSTGQPITITMVDDMLNNTADYLIAKSIEVTFGVGFDGSTLETALRGIEGLYVKINDDHEGEASVEDDGIFIDGDMFTAWNDIVHIHVY